MAKRLRSNRSMRTSALPRSDARQLALELVDLLGPSLAERKRGHTFKEMADAWMDANRARLVQPENERRHIDHMKELWALGEGELTTTAIAAVFGKLRTLLGPTTLNKLRSTGKRIVLAAQQAEAWGHTNPFAVMKRFKEPRRTYRTLTTAEVLRVLPFLRADRRREIKVSLLVGVRPGELLGMKKEDVSLERRTLLVCRSHGRDQTKTGADREIPIPDAVLEDIREAMRESPGEYVFPRADGTGRRQRADTKLTKVLRSAMSKAGLVTHYRYSCRRKGCGFKDTHGELAERRCPNCDFKLHAYGVPRNVRFYDVRHSSATLHRQAGADPMAIKLTLGHARRDVTDDIYTHLTEEDVRRELNKLELKEEDRTMPNSNTMPEAWEARALPTELPPRDSRPGVETQPLLTVKDVAERLRVTRATVYRLLERKEIRAHRVGSLFRFRPGDVEDFLGRGRQ